MTEANARLGWATQTCSAYKARLKFKKLKVSKQKIPREVAQITHRQSPYPRSGGQRVRSSRLAPVT